MTVSGSGGAWVGQHGDWTWRSGDGTIQVGGQVNGFVEISTAGGSAGTSFFIDITAPEGESLHVGDYVNATRSAPRAPGQAGLDVAGDGRGCDGSGRVTIKDIAPDLSRLWLTYAYNCGSDVAGVEPDVFGEVRINIPDADPELVTAPTQVNWPTQAGRSTEDVPVTLINPGASPVTIESATTSGDAAFAVSGNTCTVVDPGAACTIEVAFTPPSPGPYSGSLTVTDSTTAGSHVVPLSGSAAAVPVTGDVTTDKPKYAYDEVGTVTARMGGTWVDPTVSIYRVVGTKPKELLTTQKVDSQGEATVSVPITADTTFRLEWSDGTQSGTDSTLARVVPVTVYSVTRGASTANYGQSVRVTATLTGAYPNPTVKFYRQVTGGSRVLVATKDVDSSGKVSVLIPVRETSYFVAEWTDGVTRSAKQSDPVYVYPKFLTAMTHYLRISSKGYALYRAGQRMYLHGTLLPAYPGRCVYSEVQVAYANDWRPLAYTRCVKTSSTGSEYAYLVYDKALLGRSLRFRATFRRDDRNLKVTGPWKYAKWVS